MDWRDILRAGLPKTAVFSVPGGAGVPEGAGVPGGPTVDKGVYDAAVARASQEAKERARLAQENKNLKRQVGSLERKTIAVGKTVGDVQNQMRGQAQRLGYQYQKDTATAVRDAVSEAVHKLKHEQRVVDAVKHPPFWKDLKGSLPKFLAGAAVLGGIGGGIHLTRRLRERAQAKNNFESMLRATPGLKHEPERLVKDRFRTLQHVAPNLAADPLVAGSVVKQWVEYPVVNAAALKDVVSVEKELRRDLGLAKTYGGAAAGLVMGS